MPLRPVPLHERNAAVPVMIGATQLNRCGKAFEAQFLQTRGGDIAIFQTTAHVLAVDILFASNLLSRADCLSDEDRVPDGAVIEVLADFVL